MAELRRVHNPPSPFESRIIEWDEVPPPEATLEVFEEEAKSIIAENDSPDVGFRFGVNPYRGCFHGCIYCYARPSHQYWGFGAGSDFDRKIVVKVNAPELLAKELARDRCRGEALAFSGNTDCYQPLEASYALTRRCLEVCLEARQPVGIITKGTVIRRDVELLAALHEEAGVQAWISLAFSDDAMRKAFDPYAPPVDARLETLRRLAQAGVPVGVALAPILPGINESMIPAILERAAEAGARRAFMTLVRLPREVHEVFDVRLEEVLPARARKVRQGILDMRGGRPNDPRFGARMRGTGPRWHAVEQMFATWTRRLGMNQDELPALRRENAKPPVRKGQLDLF
jgi:DNA repair photolyase